jgi:hypothetical protein
MHWSLHLESDTTKNGILGTKIIKEGPTFWETMQLLTLKRQDRSRNRNRKKSLRFHNTELLMGVMLTKFSVFRKRWVKCPLVALGRGGREWTFKRKKNIILVSYLNIWEITVALLNFLIKVSLPSLYQSCHFCVLFIMNFFLQNLFTFLHINNVDPEMASGFTRSLRIRFHQKLGSEFSKKSIVS